MRKATYLVECYMARSVGGDLAAATERARSAAEALRREGLQIRLVRTTLVPEDETCFHVFSADSAETVLEATKRAGFSAARVTQALEATPQADVQP